MPAPLLQPLNHPHPSHTGEASGVLFHRSHSGQHRAGRMPTAPHPYAVVPGVTDGDSPSDSHAAKPPDPAHVPLPGMPLSGPFPPTEPPPPPERAPTPHGRALLAGDGLTFLALSSLSPTLGCGSGPRTPDPSPSRQPQPALRSGSPPSGRGLGLPAPHGATSSVWGGGAGPEGAGPARHGPHPPPCRARAGRPAPPLPERGDLELPG